MFESNQPRMIVWDTNEDFECAKKAILAILKEQKVSLSKTRTLFKTILDEIEDENIINL